MKRSRFNVESISRRRGQRIAWIRDEWQGRVIGVCLRGLQVVVFDQRYDRPPQPVANPTLRKVAREVLG